MSCCIGVESSIGSLGKWYAPRGLSVWTQLDEVLAADALAQRPAAHILMLHPGYVDAQLMRNSSLTIPRTVDAEILRSSALRDFCTREDIELVTYRDL